MWLFPGVEARMLFQKGVISERLPTRIACKWAFATVPHKMVSQAPFGQHGSIANRAGVSEIIIITGES